MKIAIVAIILLLIQNGVSQHLKSQGHEVMMLELMISHVHYPIYGKR